jgi:nucleotide-binding universal stress UspA family protein
MFTNVLVGVRDEESGRDAIGLATTLVARDGQLTLAHVFHEDRAVPWGFTDAALEEKREEARALLERVIAGANVPAHLRWRGAPSVGHGLHELAEIAGADLLVVGSSRKALLGRVRLADDTRSSLNGAPCAVAIAPAGYGSEPAAPWREIGVGYDGSPESEYALSVARTLAGELDSKLSAFQAVAIPVFGHHGLRRHVDVGLIKQVVEQARERIAAQVGVEPHAAYGDPVEELTVYSASLDLLVVGSRNYGPVGRLVHGTLAQHLARTVRCPLLVLMRGAGPPMAPVEPEGVPDTVQAAG